MNYAALNKKWSSYYNWTMLYPCLFLIGVLAVMSGYIFANINNLNNYENIFGIFAGVFIIGMVALFALIPYFIWFIVASDSLAKTLGWNRILFNILNIFSIFSCLYFISIIVFWIKIKETFDDAGFETTWSGKLKRKPE